MVHFVVKAGSNSVARVPPTPPDEELMVLVAAAYSKENLQYSMSHHPQAQGRPTSLPSQLLDLAITTNPNWTSK